MLLLAAGGYAFFTLGQKEDPDFTFRVMVVQVLWPGASVEEMQEQVVDKVERKLQETPGLEFLRSYTRPGSAAIFVNLRGNVRGDAVADAFYQVRKKIGDIRHTLPEGVVGPFFNDEFGDTYMSLYAITGQGYAYPELKTFAKNARDILLRIPGVAKVDLLGTQEERIFIEVSSAALAERGLTALDIQAALAGQNAMDPAGRIETSERSVRIDGGRAGSGRWRTSASCACARASRPSGSATSPRSSARWRTRPPPRPATRARRRCCSAPPWPPATTSRWSAPRWSARSRRIERELPVGVRARQGLRPGPGGEQVRARVPALARPRRSASCSSSRSSRWAGAPASSWR